MDRKALLAFTAMAASGVTLIIDGIVTLAGRSGDGYKAYRIFVSGGGRGMNHFVGRGEIISGVLVALLSLGLLRDGRLGWIVGAIFGLFALGGLSDVGTADRVVAACGVVILVVALFRRRENQRGSAQRRA